MRYLIWTTVLLGCGDKDLQTIETDVTDTDADTDTDTDTDTDADTDTDTDTDTDPPTGVVERNFSPTCATFGQIYPSAGEEGHWAAARITPTTTPFTLEKVIVEMSDDAFCDGAQGFTVEVWIDTPVAPDASPAVLQRFELSPAAVAGGIRSLEGVLPTPEVIEATEHIYIAVQLDDDSSCARTCADTGASDRNYWSNAVTPPYSWVTLNSFGIQSDLVMEAHGFN